jgi:hypothetical protein
MMLITLSIFLESNRVALATFPPWRDKHSNQLNYQTVC